MGRMGRLREQPQTRRTSDLPDGGCDVLSERVKLEEELKALDLRQQQLEARIREARNRHRYSPEPEVAAQAVAEEEALVKELDHLMTRVRAVEGRLLLAKSGRKTPWS
jgi:predicted  nucleic acid-binding Zn-ribbon protein